MEHEAHDHTHGAGVELEPVPRLILQNGLRQLLRLTALVMFKTEAPRAGIGIMHRGYKGRTPDGRTWGDLHYALAGKQAPPGLAGGASGYLKSPRFLAAHDGWDSVVWVSPKIAAVMGEDLPAGVEVGGEVD